VGGRGLSEGESFSILYGNVNYYGTEPFSRAGAAVRELSGPAEFTVAVDADGKRSAPYSGFVRIEKQPVLEILPAKPVQLRAVTPCDVRPGNPCTATLVTLDQFNNPVGVERRRVPPPAGDVARMTFRRGGLETRSNPVKKHAGKVEERIFWGDVHGHTRHSDGLGSVDEYYAYAREVAALDFAAITDHDDIGPRLSDEEWQVMRRAAEDANDPGRFVSLLGYEYRNGLCDMNVYYPSSEGELLRGTDGALASADELTRRLRRLKGMIVPHMHFGADWSGFDPDVYRVMEIYSQHGSAEFAECPREIPYLRKQLQKSSKTNEEVYAHDVLAAGRRLGFTAGSDTHAARPGLSDWTRVCRTYLGGLTAVFAGNLTREDIWRALFERRCYATTGNRSILEFTVNGAAMGSEIVSTPRGGRQLSLVCHADGELESITIFRSGECWVHEELSGESVERTFDDDSRRGADWYYARVDLTGGEMVWSSPVWVDV